MVKNKLEGATSKLDTTLSLFPKKEEEKKKVGFIKDSKESKFSTTSISLCKVDFNILDDIRDRVEQEVSGSVSNSKIIRALLNINKNIKTDQILKHLREISL